MTDGSEEYLRSVEAALLRGLQRVGIECANDLRQLISIPSRTVAKGTYAKGKRKGQAKTILGKRGSNRSKPGEAPHKDLGTLRSSIAFQVDPGRKVVLVGTSLKTGRWLELGTSRMGARPFLRPTLVNHREKYARLMTQDLPRKSG